MPAFIEPILSFVQKIRRFIKNAWESVYAYGRYLRAWFAPKPYGFEAALDRVWANDPSMTHLDLNNRDLSYWNIIELGYALAGNMTLSSLDLSGCQLSIASIQALIPIITLTSLNISYNQISDAGALALAANTMLTSLNISNNQIGDAGAQTLAANTTLTSLNVSNNQIGDAGAQALAANTTLTSLNVSSNQIGSTGGLAITSNSTLRSLWINNNYFVSSPFNTLSNMLDHHFSGTSSTLEFLDIREDNQLNDEVLNPNFHPNPGFNWSVRFYRGHLLLNSEVRAYHLGIYRAVNAFSSIVNKPKDTLWLSPDIISTISSFLTKRSVHSIITRAEKRGLRMSDHLQQETANTEALTSELTDGPSITSMI